MYFGFSSNLEKINVLETTESVVLCCFSYSVNQCFQNVKEYLTLGFLERLIIEHLSFIQSTQLEGTEKGFWF